MTPPDEHHVKVVRMFMGTRADLAPYPLAYRWDCQHCHLPTYSAAEPPIGHTSICNVCASQLTTAAEQDSATDVAWRMTDEGETIAKAIAEEKQRPVEEVVSRFLEWKLRQPTKVVLYRKPEEKTDS